MELEIGDEVSWVEVLGYGLPDIKMKGLIRAIHEETNEAEIYELENGNVGHIIYKSLNEIKKESKEG